MYTLNPTPCTDETDAEGEQECLEGFARPLNLTMRAVCIH